MISGLCDYWYIVARAKAVRKKPRRVQLFGQNYVLFVGNNEQIVALEDRCPHRNAPLSAGKVCAGEIQCPYHGWQFDQEGTLTRIPALNEPPPALSIPTVHVRVQDDYVWLCPGTPVQPRPLPFAHLGKPGWRSFRMKTRFDAPVAQCLENFLDCPHAVYVHTSWFRAPTHKPVQVTLRTLEDGAQLEYANEPREKSLVWKLLQNSNSEMRHTDRFIAPATSRVDYRFSDQKHYIITSSCTPLDENTTEVHTVISFKYGVLGPLIGLIFQPLSHLIIRQDVEIMRKQRENIHRFGGVERFYLSQADMLMPSILAWRNSLEKGRSPPPAGHLSSKELRL